MSTGNYTHTTRATGTVLTAAIYNADHINHITNQNPQQTGAYSDNVTQMQTKTSPGGVGSESLPTSLAGEIERIRFQLNAIIGGAQWYSAPAATLAGLAGAGVPDDSITNLKLANMAAGTIKSRNIGIGTGDPQDLTLTQVLDFVGSAANSDMLFRTGGSWTRLPIGSSNQVLTVSGGVPAWVNLATTVKAADQQTFNSSGTWTKPSGFGAKAMALIQVWGGGAGGARAISNGTCSGGGGGGYNERLVPLSSLGGTETVTIGAGGNGGAANGNNGSAGGNTTFGSWVTGFGGGGGGQNLNGAGEGGTFTRAGSTNTSSPIPTFSKVTGSPGQYYTSNPFDGGIGGSVFQDASCPPNTVSAHGANTFNGGGGGGGKNAGVTLNPGTSIDGGSGGAAAANGSPGANGSAPGGGGAGSQNATAGNGAAGRCVVTVIDGA